jgi:hypothetical protein
LVSLLLPWAMFTVIFGLLSFNLHYKHLSVVWFIVGCFATLTCICGMVAYQALKKRWTGDPTREPNWYVFLFGTMALAWLLGVSLGCVNFASNMRPYYQVTNLNTYPGVDPAKMHGEQVMDAGRIVFTKSSHIDVSKSIGFKSDTMYCVAPIVSSTEDQLSSYDFWAVGTDCCSGDGPDFHCGSEYNNPNAHAGMRVLSESQQDMFKLAVGQAEAAYKLTASHPLFFTWTEDPIGEVSVGQDAGLRNFLLATLSFFAFQLFAVVMASLAVGFSRMASS